MLWETVKLAFATGTGVRRPYNTDLRSVSRAMGISYNQMARLNQGRTQSDLAVVFSHLTPCRTTTEEMINHSKRDENGSEKKNQLLEPQPLPDTLYI